MSWENIRIAVEGKSRVITACAVLGISDSVCIGSKLSTQKPSRVYNFFRALVSLVFLFLALLQALEGFLDADGGWEGLNVYSAPACNSHVFAAMLCTTTYHHSGLLLSEKLLVLPPGRRLWLVITNDRLVRRSEVPAR